MRFLLTILATACSIAAAQSQNSTNNQTLLAILTRTPNLTNLTSLFSSQPGVFDVLDQVTNVTFLAPSDAAFAKISPNDAGSLNNSTAFGAVYVGGEILNGIFKSSQIPSTPLFIPTHLTSKDTTNVTGGQRIEAINTNGTVSFISGHLTKSTVTQADITFNGGVIHVIDTLLTPASNVTNTSIILDLTALAGAITQTNLADTVDNTPDLTIFAPNNAAFQDIASVLANASIDTLKSVLSYHVVKGKVLYSTLIGNGSVQTLGGGSNITTTVANGSIFVNQARVVIPNVIVANGVVHVIDSVLNPDNASALPGSNSTGFANATSSSAVPFTSGVPTPTSSVPAGVTSSSTSTSASSSSSAGVAARAIPNGAIGVGMLFAGAFMGL